MLGEETKGMPLKIFGSVAYFDATSRKLLFVGDSYQTKS
jgi:hypothetical protein